MLERIIDYSIKHKLIIILLTLGMVGFGIYALMNIRIGAVPDITNNQVQVITTSRNLATQDVEKFLTYPVELEMANLPGVKEIRSVSKFGLSVVTVVFEDDMGAYLPRQLISEKLQGITDKIPEGFGTPFMGPISTGLGEIYQYVLDTKPGYKDRYSTMELRSIQDWIVKRQLSGIPGVVEVNTWGGFLKTYEVSIDPHLLKSTNISISQVYEALQNNNAVAGGGYIEKAYESFFIRGEGLLEGIEDFKNIVVDYRNGVPVLLGDIAKINFGHATRFGAITGNGEGEKVLGQVMMLKGAGSKEVIERVKERVAEIQPTLPEGVYINPFLERSELIGKTTFTIAENLILGCLIVVFVVVLLLGNIRSGLVVASVIPLSLLFAITLMYLFGIDANLMSLGAIDFGIIIDGAVIIVEYIAFKITSQKDEFVSLQGSSKREFLDKVTFLGANKMMRSAVFGQLIIIIVFIPILSLSDVEGKMFTPMALTFCFALIGAMIMCFTYVPVMSSIFLKPTKNKNNFSSKLIGFLQRLYIPTITWALQFKSVIIGIALLLLVGAVWIFSRMGGEFVPTLDEGDFVIQPVLKTGMSLSKTIEMTTRIEKILLEFPEVDQVVTRIGAAEVPTDPMSMEETDIIITLHPMSQWISASSKDELAEAFKEAVVSEIPGVEIEFTQPIEMRFNELITGVRADLAIKIFGEDLDVLYNKAVEIEKAISNVEGAADIVVEKTVGLPQMSVTYDRMKMAKYGVNIQQLNDIISMGFAGLPAGTIFEGEQQYDIVIKYDKKHRTTLEDLSNAPVLLDNGSQVPLSEFANIQYDKGPAKISRDDTRRRIVVGVNVRNRDLQSVVDDVRAIINEEIDMPAGYLVEYGGQFENLQSATDRLLVAVPVALVLIFIMLYFAFGSVREALMIYSAIPLASVGGVLLLFIRGMPFSISAGVGFIALFGIAVLNGIVLIEHFKELKAEGITDMNKLIIRGASERLRPVLLTASAAALGFLPMAVSTSSGAEVQRPLATVVIGGLISATLLTMVVLPVLYCLFERGMKTPKIVKTTKLLIVLFLLLPALSQAQINDYSLSELIEVTNQNNKYLSASQLEGERLQVLTGAASAIDKTSFFYGYDRNNIAENGSPIHVIGAGQSFRLPGYHQAKKSLSQSKVSLQEFQQSIDHRMVHRNVTQAFYAIRYWEEVSTIYARLDSIYAAFDQASQRRYELGEGNYLEKITARSKRQEIRLKYGQAEDNIRYYFTELQKWTQASDTFDIEQSPLSRVNVISPDIASHPALKYTQQMQIMADLEKTVLEKEKLPEFNVSAFLGLNSFSDAVYPGVEVGVSVPLWKGHYNAAIEAASVNSQILEMQMDNQRILLNAEYRRLQIDLEKYDNAILQFEEESKDLAEEITRAARLSFDGGEIDFFQYIQSLETALDMELFYLENLFYYNRTAIEINYLIY